MLKLQQNSAIKQIYCIRQPKNDRIKNIILQQNGKSYSEIRCDLNRSKSCIKTFIDRYNQTNLYHDRLRSGRPKISTKINFALNCIVVSFVKNNNSQTREKSSLKINI
ncbi:hypothetical protein BpHYR1_052304 [Brachionus plicatilis]|uniref:Uncharacterized protein n=1 Tax=Brachionus plicatilis TaxID=10195 RepID=A0A3M7QTI6_BRAPC|nr:hypothetical protein BpHYR1_052304 [Brachionus plicatilis]